MSILAALQKAAPYMRAAALGAAGKPIGDPQDQIRIAMLRQQSMRQVEDQKQKELDRTMAEEQFRQRMAAEQARLDQDQRQFETTEANKQAAAGQSHEWAMELQKLVNSGRISEAQAREVAANRMLERRQGADQAKQEETAARRQSAVATVLSPQSSPEQAQAAIAELKDMGALTPELLDMYKLIQAQQAQQGQGAATAPASPGVLSRGKGILEAIGREVSAVLPGGLPRSESRILGGGSPEQTPEPPPPPPLDSGSGPIPLTSPEQLETLPVGTPVVNSAGVVGVVYRGPDGRARVRSE